jgi:hypothetical protein
VAAGGTGHEHIDSTAVAVRRTVQITHAKSIADRKKGAMRNDGALEQDSDRVVILVQLFSCLMIPSRKSATFC